MSLGERRGYSFENPPDQLDTSKITISKYVSEFLI